MRCWRRVQRTAQLVRSIRACLPLHPWSWPAAPCERIHVDFAALIIGKMLLVIVDSYSKWPEIYVMNNTSASKTITVLREVFACCGIPRQLVSDNGPQFTAEASSCSQMEFATYAHPPTILPPMGQLKQ